MSDRPGIGQQVALWTTGDPPLLVSQFRVTEIPREWFGEPITNEAVDLALLGNAHASYILDFLIRAKYARRPFEIGIDTADRYDSKLVTPYLYGVVSVLTPPLPWKQDEAVSMLILLQESAPTTMIFDTSEYDPWYQDAIASRVPFQPC